MATRKNQADITSTMDSLRRIVHALRSSHRAATDLDLTGAQLFVLTALSDAGKPISVRALAERTRTDQSTASVVVGRLVDRGLVKRVRSTVDTRQVELSLTARGRALQKKTPETVAQSRLTSALSRLKANEAATLSAILAEVVEMMGEAEAPAPMMFEDSSDDVKPAGTSRPAKRASAKKTPRSR
jgi:DNA-binding MarR family transcriptional regulator